ncbi:UDP-N-acetylmuramoyl-tripeptide--D-alanyl-D-alanine ligase [Hellea balneolensis]|uniref:UDP-N-acetylmuramoyl-tripeptide--D-alanyl-D- alanine ligase n=1 Tax=Hellea balneolensis TaxID=287478 RepID=UPI0004007A9F|nr:UDP-N-acetylmuramoyl-tripeptide--D-alanyl-D-alanine ligase [Hellea balneolensis]
MSKPLWTSGDITRAVGGESAEPFEVNGISIDTRTIQAGDLFVPLKDMRDGHDFIPMALEKGAGGILSEKPMEGAAVIIEDSLQALRDMGRTGTERSEALRIAVTGSVGKTSVKEALADMFAAFGPTHKSLKSYNNHWGVPLTMARMPINSKYGIFEMGMNHAGELADLSNLLSPEIALITTVAPAHLAHFENVDAIADAKSEIMDGLAEDGILILNADNPHTPQILRKAKGKKVITFGHDDNCDVTIVTSQTHEHGSNTRLRINAQQIDVTLLVPGEHWIMNGAACMAVAYAAGVDLRKAAKALRGVRAESGRGEMHKLSLDGKSITVIDESYNANPTSMRAAINVLGLKHGRRLAVLGDMGELGKDELQFHSDLAKPLEAAAVSRVIVTGECMRALKGALPQSMRGAWAKDWDAALQALKDEIQEGDVVLVKGSNSVGLGKLVAALKKGTA